MIESIRTTQILKQYSATERTVPIASPNRVPHVVRPAQHLHAAPDNLPGGDWLARAALVGRCGAESRLSEPLAFPVRGIGSGRVGFGARLDRVPAFSNAIGWRLYIQPPGESVLYRCVGTHSASHQDVLSLGDDFDAYGGIPLRVLVDDEPERLLVHPTLGPGTRRASAVAQGWDGRALAAAPQPRITLLSALPEGQYRVRYAWVSATTGEETTLSPPSDPVVIDGLVRHLILAIEQPLPSGVAGIHLYLSYIPQRNPDPSYANTYHRQPRLREASAPPRSISEDEWLWPLHHRAHFIHQLHLSGVENEGSDTLQFIRSPLQFAIDEGYRHIIYDEGESESTAPILIRDLGDRYASAAGPIPVTIESDGGIDMNGQTAENVIRYSGAASRVPGVVVALRNLHLRNLSFSEANLSAGIAERVAWGLALMGSNRPSTQNLYERCAFDGTEAGLIVDSRAGGVDSGGVTTVHIASEQTFFHCHISANDGWALDLAGQQTAQFRFDVLQCGCAASHASSGLIRLTGANSVVIDTASLANNGRYVLFSTSDQIAKSNGANRVALQQGFDDQGHPVLFGVSSLVSAQTVVDLSASTFNPLKATGWEQLIRDELVGSRIEGYLGPRTDDSEALLTAIQNNLLLEGLGPTFLQIRATNLINAGFVLVNDTNSEVSHERSPAIPPVRIPWGH